MSENLSKKVLFIAYHFPPIGGSGVQRSLKYVKYLPSYNCEPIVVTVKNGHNFAYDFSMLDEIPENTKIYRSNSGEKLWLRKAIENTNKNLVKVKGLLSKFKEGRDSIEICNEPQTESIQKETIKDKVFRYLEYNYYVPDTKIRWFKHAIKDIKNRVLKENDIDVIYSTSSPYTDHLIALEIKKITNKPWIADFRDPWIGNDAIMSRYSVERIKKEEKMERDIIELADKVINVTEPITEMYKKRYPEFIDKFVTITNGFDKNDGEDVEVVKSDTFKISYTGLLGESRNPITLINVLSDLCSENEQFKKDLYLEFTGYVDSDVEKEMMNSSIRDNIKINGYVDHKEAVSIMKNSCINLMVLPDDEESKGVYTGKIFDYIMANRPILGIMPRDGVAAELINNCNVGLGAGHKEYDSIRDFVLEVYNKFKNNESLDTDGVNKCIQFDRKSLSKQLSKYIYEVCNK